ncbi:glycosyltransferase family 4 protein [Candidatus Peregrinibacteria bacterium]|nr:glycosyltransferase family 4 protein [Candidatus Peregrinibacteria bacterium]
MKSSQRNIRILTWDYGNPKGGMGRSLQWIADVLRRGGRNVRVMAPSVRHEDDETLLAFTNRFPGGHVLFSCFLPLAIACHPERRRRAAGDGETNFARVSRLFRRPAHGSSPLTMTRGDGPLRQDPDTLLIPVGSGGIFLFRMPKRVRTIAIVYHTYLQQARFVPGQQWKRIFVPFERRTLAKADQVLCFCADTAAVLQQSYGIDSVRITVLPHAIDLVSWSVASEMRRPEPGLCVCVARLEARKGVDVLLKAWPKVRVVFPHARLILVGDGHLRGAVDRAIRRSDESIERISSLPFASLISLMHRAQIAVCPSYLEGFGLSVAEAMAAGAPVVASDSDGIRNLITHGKNGWLTEAGDATALADGIVHVLSDATLRHRLATEARENSQERFDPINAEAKLLDALML